MARKAATSKAARPAKPAKPAQLDVHAIGEEFQQALTSAGIHPGTRGSTSGANLPAFLKVLADFVAKYGPTILPLLQMIFQALAHQPAASTQGPPAAMEAPAPAPTSAPAEPSPSADQAPDQAPDRAPQGDAPAAPNPPVEQAPNT